MGAAWQMLCMAVSSILLATIGLTPAGFACAQSDILSPDTLHGLVDLRLATADGETNPALDGEVMAEFADVA